MQIRSIPQLPSSYLQIFVTIFFTRLGVSSIGGVVEGLRIRVNNTGCSSSVIVVVVYIDVDWSTSFTRFR